MSAISQRTPIYVPNDAPGSLYDSIIMNGRVLDMVPGTTITLYVRPVVSRNPVISAGTPNTVAIYPTDSNGNNVRHDWQSSEITTVGEAQCMAWWQFTIPGMTAMDTPEFPIVFGDHGPGIGTQIGVIVRGVYAHMPVTASALQKDDRYGDAWLQQQAEVIKLRVLGTTVSPDSEAGLGTVLLDYLSKRLALQLINPAIEFWSRQHRTVTATQTSEVSSYPDIIASLKELSSRLVRELAQEWRDLMAIQPGLAVRHVMPLPATTLGDPGDPRNGYVTRNPRSTDPLKTGGYGWGLDSGVWPFP